MTTTIMRDSKVGDAWIRQMMQLNPPQRVIDPATGQWNGNILTGPVRLAFCDSVFEAKPQMRSDPNSKLKHMATFLFPPQTDMSIFREETWNLNHREFAAQFDRATNQFYGLDEPLVDQAAKAMKYKGFTPGCMSMVVSSNYKPAIVDPQGNPIIDPARLYAGVWAIGAVNVYASGKNMPKKGARFGLQQLMIVGDDETLSSGGGPDPRQTFAGAKVHAPSAVPGAAFGQSQQNPGSPPPPPPGIGGHTGAYYGQQGHGHAGAGAPPPPPAYAPPQPPAPAYAPPPQNGGDEDISSMM